MHYFSVSFLISFYLRHLLRYARLNFLLVLPTQFAQKGNQSEKAPSLRCWDARRLWMQILSKFAETRFVLFRDSSGLFYSGFSISGCCVQIFCWVTQHLASSSSSLVPRPVLATRVTRGCLEPSARRHIRNRRGRLRRRPFIKQ